MTNKFPLPPSAEGVLPDQWLSKAIASDLIYSPSGPVPNGNIQPASLDLRLGKVAYRLRCSFLPDSAPVEAKLANYTMETIDISEGGILERNRPYLVPLEEMMDLPRTLRAKANPKSSTGRLDIFTRVISDGSSKFDEICPGYRGALYLEIVSRSFAIKVHRGLSLNQLRLMTSQSKPISDRELAGLCATEPVLFFDGQAIPPSNLSISNGLFMSLDLRNRNGNGVGYRARKNSRLIDLGQVNYYDASEYWEVVYPEDDSIVLEPEEFYLLLSRESIRVAPGYAAEMAAYDPAAGELRTHYAGFFDPGFGHEPSWGLPHGSKAALEVRAHDVPFLVGDGQPICRLTFERMLEPPTILYGLDIGSNYQVQEKTLSKHFKAERPQLQGQLRLRMF